MLDKSTSNEIPELTQRVAKSAFPKNDNLFIKMRDELGVIYTDEAFADLFPTLGQPAEAPGRLALITVMQYAESLTDRAAADSVRSRIDWKYALGLELEDAGFNYSVLSKFRARLLAGGAENRLLDAMLTHLQAKGLLKTGGEQRTDSTHIVGAIRNLNRLVLVAETLRQTLDVLAVAAPDWLQRVVEPEWYKRYGQPLHSYKMPKKQAKREALALRIGADGHALLQAIYEDLEVVWLRDVPAVQTLRQIWVQQFYQQDEALSWRANKETPPFKQRIVSPFDTDARQGMKRDHAWQGYKVHFTETCDVDAPKLITHVSTRPAPEADVHETPLIHAALEKKALLPTTHYVDTGYMTGEHLVGAQTTYGIDLVGPVHPDTSWQSQDDKAFDVSSFSFDWDNEVATCPQGYQSQSWKPQQVNTQDVISVTFSATDCRMCPERSRCTKRKIDARTLTLRPQLEHQAIQARRAFQKTASFKQKYAKRAGVEGTMSQTAVALNMRRCRYKGTKKTHLQHLATATAVNLKRAANWLMGYATADTYVTRFGSLALAN